MNEKIVLHKFLGHKEGGVMSAWMLDLKIWGFTIANTTSQCPTANTLATNIKHLPMNEVQHSLK